MRGFTREVLTALIANIETREWRRTEIAQSQTKIPEHPLLLLRCFT